MRAAILEEPGRSLVVRERPDPVPGRGQVTIAVEACAVCRTDLHLRDGEIEADGLPRVLGHQIVGRVVALGPAAEGRALGDRVGVPWLAWTDGECAYCRTGRENLCPNAKFTGRDVDGGFAELAVADARFCLALPHHGAATELAPLLCGGLIAQVACHQGREVFAFVRRGDDSAAALARSLGAVWAGPSDAPPPVPLDAAIIFASAGELVPLALRALAPGGTVVCAGIHMTDIPGFPYGDLYEERAIRSVANLTREDGRELLALAELSPVTAHVTTYALDEAERALADLRAGAFVGSAVLEVGAAR